ncbi:MAG TPA: hypothetical protein VI968_00430 [archaeon]|nr:hypothetical protein [archaeon]
MESLETAGWIVVELVILVIMIFTIWKAVAALLTPDLQVAMLNTEILRADINEVCRTDLPVYMQGFSLTQPRPTKFAGLTTILPRFSINSAGDPNYLLYYESFPGGEGVGWELYSWYQYRLLTPFVSNNAKLQNLGDSITGSEADEFMKKLSEYAAFANSDFAQKAKGKGLEITQSDVLINNIVLSDSLGVFPEQPSPAGVLNRNEKDRGALGKWETPESAEYNNENKINNFYKFDSLLTQSLLERSLIKYRPCGENALCLKTRDGVYKYPLSPECKDIKNIELVYDKTAESGDVVSAVLGVAGTVVLVFPGAILPKKIATGIIGKLISLLPFQFLRGLFAGISAENSADAIISLTLTYKSSDFYAVSPCKIPGKIKIEQVACGNDFDSCKHVINYPIYSYKSKDGNPTIKYDGKHYKCVENIGDFDKVSDVAAYGGDRCIRISVTEERPKDFCWTADPYKETDFFDRLLSLVPGSGYLDGISGVRASGISTVFGFMPVKKSTGYAKETQSIILNPSKESELQFGEIFKALKERWGWAWPGGGVITTG